MLFESLQLGRRFGLIALVVGLLVVGSPALPAKTAPSDQSKKNQNNGDKFTDQFFLDECNGFSSSGTNPYFVLQPGYKLVLEGEEDGEELELKITVLNETKQVAGVQTRVVEERETLDGELIEISRNFFAICNRTNDVLYYGEEVDIYENGQVVSHEGAWLAGENGARAGVIMPGTVLLGARHFQEIAPGVAMDRAEIESLTAEVGTPAGQFDNVLKIEETSPLERGKSFKYYVRGIGLIQDGDAKLVSHGF